VKKIQLSFFSKNLLFTFIIILFVGIVLTACSYFIQGHLMLDSLYKQAFGISNHMKGLLNLEDIKDAIKNSDLNSDVQIRLTNQLTQLSDGNKNVAQGYIFGSETIDGKQLVIAMPKHIIEAGLQPGTMYQNPAIWVNAANEAIAKKEAVSTDIYKDDYGTWITIVNPIIDESGKVIAVFAIDMDSSIVHQGQMDVLLWCGLALAITLFVTFVIQFIVMRRVLMPIKEIFQAINEVSEGKLNVILEIKSKDELGQLSNRFNLMVEQLRNIIEKVQIGSEKVAVSAKELTVSVEQNTKAVDQITISIQHIASGTQTQEQSASEAARAMEEMALGVQKIAESISIVEESSAQMKEEAIKGNEYIQKVVNQMNSIKKSVLHSSDVVESLNSKTQEIVQIVGAISGISSQTNLLALNAAIEAARAGEQGKGFAVVAGEVRKLAEQSQLSANQITSLIQAIQVETANAVEAMRNGTTEVINGMEIVTHAGETFERILETTDIVVSQIQDVSAVAQQMSAGTQEVTASIEDLASIAKESADKTTSVAATSEQQLATITSISRSAETLSEMASELKDLTQKFII
jgi:methyl-accepting chemotaxis protein